MYTGKSAGFRPRLPHWLIAVFGYAVSISCLVWVYHGFDWRSELPRLLSTDWRWVTVAVVADVVVYLVQAWRWNLVLQPIERASLWRSTQAIYIGLFANEILPLRSGEVIRCYLQAKWLRLPLSVSISSVLIERFMDGSWLILGFYVITHFITLPGYLVVAAQILTLILLIFAVLLVFAVIHKAHTHRAMANRRGALMLRHIVDGTHDMGRSRSFVAAVFVSLFYLVLQILPIWALAMGSGLHLSLGAAAVVLVVLRLGSVPPQAPSNVGSFQFFTILGLRLFDISRVEATSFATLLFVVVTVPLWLGGFIALMATRMRLEDIHKDAHSELANHHERHAG